MVILSYLISLLSYKRVRRFSPQTWAPEIRARPHASDSLALARGPGPLEPNDDDIV
jgi:hypothetical protein